jgi:diguanylate cyclase (GGDEF)-like protein
MFCLGCNPAASEPTASPPIALNDALRTSIEEPKRFLENYPNWLESEYAKTDPYWQQELLMRAGRSAWLLSKSSEQLAIAQQLEAMSQREQLPKAKAYGLIVRARQRQEAADFPASIDLISQAATEIAKLDSPEARALVEVEFCGSYYYSEQTQLALQACARANTILSQLPPLPDNAKQWTFEQSDRALNHANTKNLWFITYEAAGQAEIGIQFAYQAIDDFKRLELPTMVSMVHDNMSEYLLNAGDAATALALSQESFALESKQGRAVHAFYSLLNIARAQSKLQKHKEALSTVARALDAAKQLEQAPLLASLYETQMEIAEAAGDSELALSAAQSALAANRTAHDENSARAIAEMDARFKSAEDKRELERLAQDRKIRLLELEASRSENSAQAAIIERTTLWLWLVTVSTLGLAAITILFWILWRASNHHAKRMRDLADIDGLTQLLNRRAFMERFAAHIGRLERVAEGALCIIDIDHFKRINDQHGHPVGDAALKKVANALSLNLMASSEPASVASAIIGRIGGEEFALWLPGRSVANAMLLAERLRQAVANAHQGEESLGFAMSISIGIAMLSSVERVDVAHCLAAADRALYCAKHLGRNRIEVFTPALLRSPAQETELASSS